MNLKHIILLLLLCTFCVAAFAYTPQDLSWNGFITVYLEKENFSAGDANVTGYVIVTNPEDYPIIGGRLVFQIGEGKYSYPSQFALDNIISETSINDIWVLPNSIKRVDFSLPKPQAGNYRLDVYSWILKSKYIGASNIFLSPSQKNFSVTGSSAEKKSFIDRAKTTFGSSADTQTVGPVGFPTNPSSTIMGKVVVTNPSSTSKDLKVIVSLCDWAIVFCDNPTEKTFTIGPVAAGATKETEVSIQVPQIPSAYEINIKLMNGTTTESIYKNRVIVSGGTAKIRKLFFSGLDTKKYSMTIIYSGSPDHFSNPTFTDFDITMEIYNNESLLESLTKKVTEIKFADINSTFFDIVSTSFDKACVKFQKGGIIYEEECFTVPIEEIQQTYDLENPIPVKVDYSYEEATSLLTINLIKERINAKIKLIQKDFTITEELIVQDSTFTKKYNIPKEDTILVIDDYDAKRQQVFTIEVSTKKEEITALSADDNSQNNLLKCDGIICANGETCATPTHITTQGNCCLSSCITSSTQGEVDETIPLILWIALILIIIAGIMGHSALKEGKK